MLLLLEKHENENDNNNFKLLWVNTDFCPFFFLFVHVSIVFALGEIYGDEEICFNNTNQIIIYHN